MKTYTKKLYKVVSELENIMPRFHAAKWRNKRNNGYAWEYDSYKEMAKAHNIKNSNYEVYKIVEDDEGEELSRELIAEHYNGQCDGYGRRYN